MSRHLMRELISLQRTPPEGVALAHETIENGAEGGEVSAWIRGEEGTAYEGEWDVARAGVLQDGANGERRWQGDAYLELEPVLRARREYCSLRHSLGSLRVVGRRSVVLQVISLAVLVSPQQAASSRRRLLRLLFVCWIADEPCAVGRTK